MICGDQRHLSVVGVTLGLAASDVEQTTSLSLLLQSSYFRPQLQKKKAFWHNLLHTSCCHNTIVMHLGIGPTESAPLSPNVLSSSLTLPLCVRVRVCVGMRRVLGAIIFFFSCLIIFQERRKMPIIKGISRETLFRHSHEKENWDGRWLIFSGSSNQITTQLKHLPLDKAKGYLTHPSTLITRKQLRTCTSMQGMVTRIEIILLV